MVAVLKRLHDECNRQVLHSEWQSVRVPLTCKRSVTALLKFNGGDVCPRLNCALEPLPSLPSK